MCVSARGELLSNRLVRDGKRAEEVPLEDVIQLLALRQHAQSALQSSLREPTHALRIVSRCDGKGSWL